MVHIEWIKSYPSSREILNWKYSWWIWCSIKLQNLKSYSCLCYHLMVQLQGCQSASVLYIPSLHNTEPSPFLQTLQFTHENHYSL